MKSTYGYLGKFKERLKLKMSSARNVSSILTQKRDRLDIFVTKSLCWWYSYWRSDLVSSTDELFSSVTSVCSSFCSGGPRAGQHKQGSKQGPIGKGCAVRKVDTMISYRFFSFLFQWKFPVDHFKADIAQTCFSRPEKWDPCVDVHRLGI